MSRIQVSVCQIGTAKGGNLLLMDNVVNIMMQKVHALPSKNFEGEINFHFACVSI